MPQVSFDALPNDGRVWIFAADSALAPAAERTLLAAVDAFLAEWNAHGHPLRSAREWRDGRFLAVGVDQSTAGASGCSIDGLFRTLRGLEPTLGASLLPGGQVYWRGADGDVQSGERGEFAALAREGKVGSATQVFDTTVTSVEAWRGEFERPAGTSWHWALTR